MSPSRSSDSARPWLIRIDTGGTFTDAFARSPLGETKRTKVLSSGRIRLATHIDEENRPMLARVQGGDLLIGAIARELSSDKELGSVVLGENGQPLLQMKNSTAPVPPIVDLDPSLDAPRLAMHLLTETPLNDPLPPIDLRIATTRATNALLTGRTGRVLLITTSGFEDLHLIGDQARPDIFALNPRPGRQPPVAVISVDARLDAKGKELIALNEQDVLQEVNALREKVPFDAIAIAFMHAWRNTEHEDRLETTLRNAGIQRVVTSNACSPDIRLVPRVRTAIAEASLAPTIEDFLEDLGLEAPRNHVLVMNSAGGLVASQRYRSCESLFSGPAAGVVGAVAAAKACGEERIIGFDMGGTSTDVSRHAGRSDLRDQTTVANATVRVPSLDLESVAAGGGSICTLHDGQLQVGPESAGAHPGPACYGAGGPLTLTDVNLLQGRVDPRRFGVPLDRNAAEAALQETIKGTTRNPEVVLDGFRSLADERMAEAIRTVTTRRGEDPSTHVLVAFGGAGGQHACGIAQRLGIQRIVIPADTGLLSAIGLECAVRVRSRESAVLTLLSGAPLAKIVKELEASACEEAAKDGVKEPEIVRRQLRCRLLKQDATIDLECSTFEESIDKETLAKRFHDSFLRLYGYSPPDRPIELAAIRVFAGESVGPELPSHRENQQDTKAQSSSTDVRMRSGGDWVQAPLHDRSALTPGTQIVGPAIIAESTATVVLEPGWTLRVDPSSALIIDAHANESYGAIESAAAGEIIACRLESIARDMGETLRRTALSVNVRERLDYSCGILDSQGRLVVNAPHMPVHLGALGPCVRSLTQRIDLQPGDVALVNHPAYGGSHLPDLTVVSGVFNEKTLIGYVASRAHHAEIGGTRPGSMPPDATTLEEEGVVFSPIKIVEDGQRRFERVQDILKNARYPSRLVGDNIADLEAQVAANHLGATRFSQLRIAAGTERFDSDLDALRNRCRTVVSRTAKKLAGTDRTVKEFLDDGSPIQVRLSSDGSRLRFDFTGSAAQHPGNLNAPHAVTTAAVLYALRLIAEESVPLNEGALEAADIVIPHGLLSPDFSGDPTKDPAVAIGNTETSQRVVDTLLKVLDAAACSQGTMNNLLLGDETFAYYETVCGGGGATRGLDGCDAVHTHMTNTRITDPEILEHRVPVRLEQFAVRRGSGGSGRWRGGDGTVREIRALEPLSLSLLGQHRNEVPYGLDGGEPGKAAVQWIDRAHGQRELIPGIAARELGAGDLLHIETPGGGGVGAV